jgi:uncharacterized protein YcsI (UPF0317 family)
MKELREIMRDNEIAALIGFTIGCCMTFAVTMLAFALKGRG